MASTNNLNYFSSNRAVMNINRLPNVSIQTQNFNIPSITLTEAIQVTPKVNVPLPGDKLQFEDLMIEFILDENFIAWKEVYKWIMDIASPVCNGSGTKEPTTSDAQVLIYNSHNNMVASMTFYDLWPSILTEVDITEEDSETVYKKISVTFKYSLYTIE